MRGAPQGPWRAQSGRTTSCKAARGFANPPQGRKVQEIPVDRQGGDGQTGLIGGARHANVTAGDVIGPDLNLNRVIDLRRGVDRVREWLRTTDGNIASQVLTSHTFGDDGFTTSVWRDDAAMFAAAYRHGAHRERIDRHQAAPKADRTSFTRDRALRALGSWAGRDLAGTARRRHCGEADVIATGREGKFGLCTPASREPRSQRNGYPVSALAVREIRIKLQSPVLILRGLTSTSKSRRGVRAIQQDCGLVGVEHETF